MPLISENKTIYSNHLKIISNTNFSIREIDVISCLIHNRGEKKIASLLFISPNTVKSHTQNIMRKLNCNSRENVIDIIEGSGKREYFKQYYTNLLIITFFRNTLIKIGKIYNKDNLLLYIDIKPNLNLEKITVFQQLKQDLRLANINLLKEKSDIGTKENIIKINVFVEQISKQLTLTFYKHEIEKTITFKENDNYYFAVLELLSAIINKTDLIKLSEEFKNNYHSFFQTKKTYPIPIRQVIQENTTIFKSNFKKRLIIFYFIIAATLSFLLMYKYIQQTTTYKLIESLLTNKDKIQNNIINNKVAEFTDNKKITSYLPELLSSYEKFIGREKELQQLKQDFITNSAVIISGQGGVGKSTLALEYGKIHKNVKLVRYFDADTTNKIDRKYKELAEEFNIAIKDRPRSFIMQLVNNQLNRIDTEILFIFDNVESYDDIKDYIINLPSNVKALITTRQPKLTNDKIHIHLNEFNNNEVEQYIENCLQSRHLTKEEIQKVRKYIGNLPYDIKLTVAYLLDNPLINNTKFIDELSFKIEGKLFQEFAQNTDVARQLAWKILQYASHLDPDFISMEIISKLFNKESIRISKAIKKLASLSLIAFIADENGQPGFRIHRKLQTLIHKITEHKPQYVMNQFDVIKNLLVTLDHLFPRVDNNPNDKWLVAMRLQPHVEIMLNKTLDSKNTKFKLLQSNLSLKLAYYYININIDHKKAITYAKLSLDQRKMLNLRDTKETADTLNLLGKLNRKYGSTQDGLNYSIEALQMRKRLYKGDHPDIANSLHNLSVSSRNMGERNKDLEYALLSLEMQKRLYSRDHPDIAASLTNLGMSNIYLGNFEDSIRYLEAGLQMYKALYPSNHPDIAYVLHCIAWYYDKIKDHKKVIEYAELAIDIYQNLYPEGHPYTASTLDTLGAALAKIGDVENSLKILHQALDIYKNFKMENHPYSTTAFIFYDLGVAYFKKNMYDEALEYGIKSLTMRQELYSNVKYHEEIAESLHLIADIYKRTGNKQKASKLYQDSLSMYIALNLEMSPAVQEIQQKINLIK